MSRTKKRKSHVSRSSDFCSVPGCGRPFAAKGVCYGHYSRKFVKKFADWDAPIKASTKYGTWVGRPCAITSCPYSASDGAKGYCSTHYKRSRFKPDLLWAPVRVQTKGRLKLSGISVESQVFWEIRRLAAGRGMAMADVHREALDIWFKSRRRDISERRAAQEQTKTDAWSRREEDTVQLG